MAQQEFLLPAFGGLIAFEFGIAGDQELQPGVAGFRIGLHVTLGQRQGLGMLTEPLIGLHQHLQDLLVGLIGRAQQADDLGIAPLDQVQACQIEALAGQQLLVQLAAGHGLVQPLQRLPVVAFGPGQIASAAPEQSLFVAPRLGARAVQRLACSRIVALALRGLRSLERHEHGRVDGLGSLDRSSEGKGQHKQQTKHFSVLLAGGSAGF